MSPSTIALHEPLLWAARALHAVAQGSATHQAMAEVPALQRAATQALLFHALRHWGVSQALLAQLSQSRLKPRTRQLLCVALALLDAPSDGVRYSPHTVVNQAVQACKAEPASRAAAGLVNACLRRYLREQAELRAVVARDVLATSNHPAWWLSRLQQQYPAHWPAIVQADLQAAPMVLRVNPRHHQAGTYAPLLAERGWAVEIVGPQAVVLAQAVPVQQLPGFEQGWVSVQDASAQQAAPLVWASPRLQAWSAPSRPKILDACAAPGGKTAHLLELGDADVLALDVDAQRLQRVHDNLQRLGLHAEVEAADAGQAGAWQAHGPWDAILLDAPCSASGIARRHPDVLWLRRESDLTALAKTQAHLLNHLWPQLKVGGRLVYATCSVFQEEGQGQIQAFLSRHPDARAAPAPGHWLPQRLEAPRGDELSHNAAMAYDGFFYAVLDKV